MSKPPNPGSDIAIEQGCTCAVSDNAHGRGYAKANDGTPVFWITEGCPLHDHHLRSLYPYPIVPNLLTGESEKRKDDH